MIGKWIWRMMVWVSRKKKAVKAEIERLDRELAKIETEELK